MQVDSSLTGPFPRSEALVRATRDLDRGRTSAEEVGRLYRSTATELARLEQTHHLAPATGGYLRWADLFRPFAEGWSGFEVGPVTRWYETNTFYRQPILHAPPDRSAGALGGWFPAAEAGIEAATAKAILPGPYTFATMIDNRSGETTEALIHRIGRLLAAEVAELRTTGYLNFQFQEPSLVVHPPAPTAGESTIAAYRAIAETLGTAPSYVWSFFGDAAPVLPLLRRLPAQGVGVDLAETEVRDLAGHPAGRGLGLGVLDPRTTLLENPADIARQVHAACEAAGVDRVQIGPGGPLDLLPWESAVRKLPLLNGAQTALRNGGGRS